MYVIFNISRSLYTSGMFTSRYVLKKPKKIQKKKGEIEKTLVEKTAFKMVFDL